MKKTLFVIAAVIACSVSASGQFYAPADTVYLKSGDKVAVHIKKIENGDPQKGFGYQVFTQESMELVGSDVWAIGIGGYQWVSNKYKEGWWGVEIDKIVFADGFVLPFRGGQIDRSLLLNAPTYKGSSGLVLAEGVVELTKPEMKQVMGDKAYYLGYQIYKRQAAVGLTKALVGGPGVFGCYIAKNKKFNETTDYPVSELGVLGIDYAVKKEMNAFWHTAMPFSIVTTVYGIGEMLIYNGKIRSLANNFKSFSEPGNGTLQTILGAGLTASGVAVTYLGYKKIKDKGAWYDLYVNEDVANRTIRTKKGTKGSKPGASWLLPAAGALLVNFGISELAYGINCNRGHKLIRDLGLERAEIHMGIVPGGVGLCMTF